VENNILVTDGISLYYIACGVQCVKNLMLEVGQDPSELEGNYLAISSYNIKMVQDIAKDQKGTCGCAGCEVPLMNAPRG